MVLSAAGLHRPWLTGVAQHLRHGGRLATGQHLDLLTGLHAPGSYAAPENAAALAGVAGR